MDIFKQSLTSNARLLKSKVSIHAFVGLIISCLAIIVATFLVSYSITGAITVDGIIQAQKTNIAIWILDITPFLFTFWGQYVGSVVAYEASAMVIDQTNELRVQTSALEAQVMYDMTHDALTGLPNSSLFIDRLNQALSNIRQTDSPLAVFLVSLNNFSEINHSLGHYNGDRILRQVAVRFSGVIHEPNTTARLSSDEFAVLISHINNNDEVIEYAKKIQNALTTPFALEELSIAVQAAIGIALFPEHGVDSDTLLQRAEVAMYAAKQKDKPYLIYSTELDKNSQRRLILMNDLRSAIENNNLTIFYQPTVDISTGALAAEALVRWQHAEYGLMSADDFFPLAERTGLMKQLADWTFNKALQQCGEWHKRGIKLDVSIKMPPAEMLDVELPEKIIALINKYHVSPEWLILEITESAMMKEQESVLQTLNLLSQKGIKIAISSFGTGYSSLGYLSKLPINLIKIDRSFVMNMNANNSDAKIVHATIDLAHNLGLKVVAEGVEHKETLAQLKKLGCDAIQGNLISPPMALKDLEEWLVTSLWSSEKKTT